MSRKLRVSVIIPTHRRPRLLVRSVRSVLTQTSEPDEVIVVDDANCDETRKVLKEFGNKVLYVVNEQGKGAPSSRNIGAQVATGDFVGFLDDDDEWLPQKLEKQVERIQEKNLDACFSQIQIVYENLNFSYPTNSRDVGDPLKEILKENFIGGTISALVKRDKFIKVGGFDESFPAREEYDLWIRLISSGGRIGIVEEPLAIAYRSFFGRLRISADINNYEKAIEMLNNKHKNLLISQLSPSESKERLKKQMDFLAAQAISINLGKVAFTYYVKSLLVKPSLKSFVGAVISIISPKMLITIRSKI